MKRFISLFAIISMIAANIVLPVSASAGTVNTPNTPLYLFNYTMENYGESEAITLFDADSTSSLDSNWEIPESLSNTNQYSIVTDADKENSAISLTPLSEEGSPLCILNMKDTINFLGDYVLNVDISTEFATSTSVAGIRISHPYDDTAYYELAFIIDQGMGMPRFTKVENATANTIATSDQWKYYEYGEEQDISSYSWLKVFLAKKDNTVYWSVINKASGETLWFGSYEDEAPLFADLGRLQLFAYSTDENSASVLFDNVDAKKLGATFFRDYNDGGAVKVEASWVNDSNNPPLIAVADYDENGRLLNVQTLSASDGYYISDEGISLFGAEQKLFVWDGETNQPIYDVAVYVDTDVYQVPAEEYILQCDRRNTFANGGGIGLSTMGTVRVDQSAALYVNGIIVSDYNEFIYNYDEYGNPIYTYQYVTTDEMLDKFLGNAQGNIKFAKTNPASSSYDQIHVDYYEVGIVTSVSYRAEKTTINFTPANDMPFSSGDYTLGTLCRIEIDDEFVNNGEVTVYAEKDRKAIELKDLQKGDAIAVATNFSGLYPSSGNTYIINPEFINVIATDKAVTGMVYEYDDDTRSYSIDGTFYKCVDYNHGLAVGVTYKLPLDPFGRIIEADALAASTLAKFAIFEKYSDDTGMVSLLLADGTAATYELGNGNLSDAELDAMEGDNVIDRVVTYRMVGDTVKLYEVSDANRTYLGKYNSATGKLGSVSITDNVNIINAEQYIREEAEGNRPRITDYAKLDVSELKNQIEYEGVAFRSGDVYNFIVITQAGTLFAEDSRFAVITKDAVSKLYDGSVCVGTQALYNGEEITLYWDTSTPSHVPVGEGDVIYFLTDKDGYVKYSYTIYNRETGTLSNTLPAGSYVQDNWNFGFSETTADIQVVSGAIADITENSITFGVQSEDDTYGTIIDGNVYDDPTGSSGMFVYGISDECQAYVFDDTIDVLQSYKKYDILDVSTLTKSNLVEVRDTDGYGVDYIYDTAMSTLHNSVAIIVDGKVVCIFVSYPVPIDVPDYPEKPEVVLDIDYAIFEKYSSSTDTVTMLLADGTTASYELGNGDLTGAVLDALEGSPIVDRVVSYTISDGAVKLSTVTPSVTFIGKEYNQYTNRIGSVAITDNLNIINAQYYLESPNPRISDYETFDSSDFETDVVYEGYAYRAGDAFTFMIITAYGPTFTKNSRFAVITKDPAQVVYNDSVCVNVQALYNGEKVTLYWDTTNPDSVPVGEGDVIFFTTDKYGFVDNTYTIFSRRYNELHNSLPDGSYSPDDWYFGFDDTPANIKLISGIVADVNSKSITFGKPQDGLLNGNVYEDKTQYGETEADLEGMFTFGIAEDCTAYIYDGTIDISGSSYYKRYSTIDASSIIPSDLVEQQIYGENVDYVYDVGMSILTEAAAMVVNGEIVAIFATYPTVY